MAYMLTRNMRSSRAAVGNAARPAYMHGRMLSWAAQLAGSWGRSCCVPLNNLAQPT